MQNESTNSKRKSGLLSVGLSREAGNFLSNFVFVCVHTNIFFSFLFFFFDGLVVNSNTNTKT